MKKKDRIYINNLLSESEKAIHLMANTSIDKYQEETTLDHLLHSRLV